MLFGHPFFWLSYWYIQVKINAGSLKYWIISKVIGKQKYTQSAGLVQIVGSCRLEKLYVHNAHQCTIDHIHLFLDF